MNRKNTRPYPSAWGAAASTLIVCIWMLTTAASSLADVAETPDRQAGIPERIGDVAVMAADAVFLRPLQFGRLVVGAGLLAISSPFMLPDAAFTRSFARYQTSYELLVEEPSRDVFVRKLGALDF